jgi:hydrogenase nickel incorporation protein HypA/HybF
VGWGRFGQENASVMAVALPAGVVLLGLGFAAQMGCQGEQGEISCTVGPVHELSIMQSALSLALDQARQAGAARVHVILLRIGALSGVVPDALEFAFEALTPGTLAEGAELAVERVPARFWCAVCAREFVSDDMFAECPDCHRVSGELRAGREMELASLEID